MANLFIDGENLRHYLEAVLKSEGVAKRHSTILNVDLNKLFVNVLQGFRITRKRFYSAKIHFHKNAPKKSKILIYRQRTLKSNLENRGFEGITAGHVRAHEVIFNHKKNNL